MTHRLGSELDDAYDALRAWCHERPELRDPSICYSSLGTINALVGTLRHIVELTSRSARNATGTDDDGNVDTACEQIDQLTRNASRALEEARVAISGAHEITSHLIFGMADDREISPPLTRELIGDEGRDVGS